MILDAVHFTPSLSAGQLDNQLPSPEPLLPKIEIDLDVWREWVRERFKRRPQVSLAEIENNSVVPPESPLLPLQPIVFTREEKKGPVTEDLTSNYQREFEYMALTQGAEFNSPRTDFFEDYMRRMLDGESYAGPIRLVILNRTSGLTAFVSPDGSVFISQALINLLRTKDEVLAVIAHELGHLINKTSETKFKLPSQSYGTAWVHEFLATDLLTAHLLEKVGLNSQALANGFLKMQSVVGNERGTAHQSNLSRSINMKLLQKFLPSTTSAVEIEDLEPEFLTPAQKNNFELVEDVFASKNAEIIKAYLLSLHPEDLAKVITREVRHAHITGTDPVSLAFSGFLTERLQTDNPRLVRLFFSFMFPHSIIDAKLRNPTVESVLVSIDEMTDLIISGQADEWWQTLFSTRYGDLIGDYFQETMTYFVSYASLSFYHTTDRQGRSSLTTTTLTDDSLFRILDGLRKMETTLTDHNLSQERLDDLGMDSVYSGNLVDYIEVVFLNQKSLDVPRLTQLLRRFKGLGVQAKIYERDLDLDHPLIDQLITLLESELGITIRLKRDVFHHFYPQLEDFFAAVEAKMATDTPEKVWGMYWNEFSKANFYSRKNMDTVASAKPEERNANGRKFIEWIENLNLDEYIPDDFTRETFRYSLLGKVLEDCFTEGLTEDESLQLTEALMARCSLDLDTLSYGQIFQLIDCLKVRYSLVIDGKTKIVDSDRIFATRFFKALSEKKPRNQAASLPELITEIENRNTAIGTHLWPFSIETMAFWTFGDVADQVISLLPTLSAADIPQLIEFIKLLPQENQTFELRRKVEKYYISPDCPVALEDKINFMLQHSKDFGYGDLVVISRQITTIDQFELFYGAGHSLITTLISGERDASGAAALDIAASALSKGIATLDTIDTKTTESATKAAKTWLGIFDSSTVQYEPPDKISVGTVGQSEFALKDIFSHLRNLDILSKIAIAARVLSDTDSPLTSNEKTRTQLLTLIFNVFGLKNSFVRLGLEGAVNHGRRDYVGLQLAQLIGPLLFRNLTIPRVQIAELQKKLKNENEEDNKHRSVDEKKAEPEYIPHLKTLFESDSATLFDGNFSSDSSQRHVDPKSQIGRETITTQRANYQRVDSAIREKFGLAPLLNEERDQDTITAIDSNEAVISALERGGALFVRCLQIGSQLFSFEPTMANRLANTLDQAEKMDDFRFWLALKTYADKYPHFGEWVRTHNLRKENVIGGGSLYTTYAVTITENGQDIPAVLKLLKPNSEAELVDARDVSMAAIEHIVAKGGKRDKDTARLAKRIVEMAYQWCKDDINDTDYPVDDQTFAATIENFNRNHNQVHIEQSTNFFVDTFAMCESRFTGQTLNSYLQNPAISPAMKRQAFNAYQEFFLTQAGSVEIGQTELLAHSDPHVGNYQVLAANEEGVRLGMMDRRLYLHDTPAEREILQAIRNGNNQVFLRLFVERMCDIEHRPERATGLIRKIKTRIISRRVRTVFDRKQSFIGDFNLVLTVLENEGVSVPYEWQLRIRNEFMFKRTAQQLASVT